MINILDYHIGRNWESFHDFCSARLRGVKTGLPVLDRNTMGLRALTCIMGSTGTNKSTLAQQISKYYAENNGPVLYYDRENGLNRIRSRLICQQGNIAEIPLAHDVAKGGGLSDVHQLVVQKLNFIVIPDMLLEDISGALDQAIEYYKKPPLLVIDSLQKLPMNLSERRNSIDEWIIGLDALKVKYEHKARILFISEKNKAGNDVASINSAKESSAISYAAELGIDLQKTNDPNVIKCTITKDRDGPDGYSFELRKVLVDPSNLRSFSYKLIENEDFAI